MIIFREPFSCKYCHTDSSKPRLIGECTTKRGFSNQKPEIKRDQRDSNRLCAPTSDVIRTIHDVTGPRAPPATIVAARHRDIVSVQNQRREAATRPSSSRRHWQRPTSTHTHTHTRHTPDHKVDLEYRRASDGQRRGFLPPSPHCPPAPSQSLCIMVNLRGRHRGRGAGAAIRRSRRRRRPAGCPGRPDPWRSRPALRPPAEGADPMSSQGC